MGALAVTFAHFLLKLPLSLKNRTALLNAILVGIDAIPLQDIISYKPDRTLIVRGNPLSLEKAIQLREGARAALNNETRKLIKEQVLSLAGKRGVVEATTPEHLYFYRAAIWFALAEEELYRELIGEK